jgi:branched-chain amino acid transport system ATP-binding protein
VQDLHTYYGESWILRGVSLTVAPGETVALLGRNGAGKTTLILSVAGLVPARQGVVSLFGREVGHLPPHLRARAGLGLVPQGRRIFPSLTVRENIEVAARDGSAWDLERLLDIFPALRPRLNTLAGRLSGGEQQMLAIARALRSSPKVLLLDEPSEGLAVRVREQLLRLIGQLHGLGLSVVLAEQNVSFALEVSSRVYLLSEGRIVFGGDAAQFQAQREQLQRQFLGV